MSPLWLLVHVGLIVTGVLLGVAGIIVALVSFGSDGPGPFSTAHGTLGLIAVGEWLFKAFEKLARVSHTPCHATQ